MPLPNTHSISAPAVSKLLYRLLWLHAGSFFFRSIGTALLCHWYTPQLFISVDGDARTLALSIIGAFMLCFLVTVRPAQQATKHEWVRMALIVTESLWILTPILLIAVGPPVTQLAMQLMVLNQVLSLSFCLLHCATLTRFVAPNQRIERKRFASRSLRRVAVGLGLFGLIFAFAPAVSEAYWNWVMFHGSPPAVASDPYLRFVFGILGVVLTAWMVLIHEVARHASPEEGTGMTSALALSVFIWFVSDTVFSCLAGFAQNAVSNGAFVLVLAVPIAMLWTPTEHRS